MTRTNREMAFFISILDSCRAYIPVPEENLLAPEEPYLDRFDHPYASFLFYGVDSAGDFIPVKQLREKYSKPRHEIPYNPQDEECGDDA